MKLLVEGKTVKKFTCAALVVSVLFAYGVKTLAKRQLLSQRTREHQRVLVDFTQKTKASTDSSAYWQALNELRKQLAFSKVDILIEGQTGAEEERRLLEVLKGKPLGLQHVDEKQGWVRSFYLLPTKNASALQVSTYFAEDMKTWSVLAALSGLAMFLCLFVTVAVFFAVTSVARRVEGERSEKEIPEALRAQFTAKIQTVTRTLQEIEKTVAHLRENIREIEQSGAAEDSATARLLEDLSGQIRVIAVNGSIESAKSSEGYRIFYVMMQEIGQLAECLRQNLKAVASGGAHASRLKEIREKVETLQEALSGAERSASFQSTSEGATAKKRSFF